LNASVDCAEDVVLGGVRYGAGAPGRRSCERRMLLRVSVRRTRR